MHPAEAPGKTDYRQLAVRMGEDLLRQRIHRQADIWARGTHQGRGIFALERFIPLDELVDWALRAVGLKKRGLREMLDIRVIENPVTLAALPPAFDQFRLLHLSDLHCDIHPQMMDTILAAVDQVTFDFAVLTGDYHNKIGRDARESLRQMERLIERLRGRAVGILGNHDFIEKTVFLERCGLPILLNESFAIRRKAATLYLCGIDDPHFFGTHNLAKAREGVAAQDCAILLSHSPEVWREAEELNYALLLAGHLHGGQLCLPGGRYLVKNAPVPSSLVKGAWHHKNLQGYTSVGAGACGVAARLNCPPEITVHILRSPAVAKETN